jgi:hypothetical protein
MRINNNPHKTLWKIFISKEFGFIICLIWLLYSIYRKDYVSCSFSGVLLGIHLDIVLNKISRSRKV